MEAKIKCACAFIVIEKDVISDWIENKPYAYCVKLYPSVKYNNDTSKDGILLKCDSFAEVFAILGLDKDTIVNDSEFAKTISEFLAQRQKHSLLVKTNQDNNSTTFSFYDDKLGQRVECSSFEELKAEADKFLNQPHGNKTI